MKKHTLKKAIDLFKVSRQRSLKIIFLIVTQVVLLQNGLVLAKEVAASEITLSGRELRVITAETKQTIWLNHDVNKKDISWEDLNFDGHPDLKILSSRGASQEFYDVYLFNFSVKKYVYSKRLSALPCIQADLKRHQIVGTCFHENACENWSERYSINKSGKLNLLERVGTYCDTATGEAFSYVDRFSNGKRISSKVAPMKNESMVQ
ncbi:hypothetical protein B0G71_2282 [Paraburkholderia sp. BL27I4N3]|uniref:XAC2610-related protein n=1 Tax=Paraburkholderia sp. BL27I4N3 TaxID=1938805 RepID=UPI000E390416|nr:hypothetical protein [Paraburkholderia sp. BL27I4N3]REE19208.1 hypothetical protein B0G71_2282 [Paraburkholderia sp. BL27I4N3]